MAIVPQSVKRVGGDQRIAGEGWCLSRAQPRDRRVSGLCVAEGSAELDARLLLHFGGFDLITDLDVVELTETNTGLEVRADLGDVILEAT